MMSATAQAMFKPLRYLFLLTLAVAGSASQCQAQTATTFPAGSPIAAPIRYQLAIYFSAVPVREPMAVLQEQLGIMASGPKLVASIPDKPVGDVLHASLKKDVQKRYRPPSVEMLQRFGRGLTRDQALAIQTAEQALVLDFAHSGSSTASAYRAALHLTEQIARKTNGLLWDEETREVFTPDEWHKRRLETWDGDTPDVSQHTVIHAYNSGKLVRAITLGMAKFGLPDLVVSDFTWSSNQSVGNLINALAQSMMEGSVIKTQGIHDLDVRSIKHTAARQSLLKTLKPNSTAVAKLTLVKGSWEAGDPRNRLVEIRFDRVPGPDRHARQDATLSAMFGSEDPVTRIRHTNELLAASKAANAKLAALRDIFNRGLQPGEYIMVKAPFEVPAGGNEWMWVEVTSWSGDTINGLLKNDPADIPTLRAGQMVKVSQSKVFDYIRRDATGREEGNETGKILQRMPGGTK